MRRLLGYELTLAAFALTLALIVAVLVPGHTPGPFSLGSLNAPVTPVRWLGLGSGGVTWRSEIASLTFVITAVTATFVYLAVRSSFSSERALASAHWILLFAALNAAGEEWLYRVALLRASHGVLSGPLVCALSAAVFGIAHLGGMPGGLTGSLAAGILGYVLARVTLDTSGIATAWLVHFLQDIVIFTALLGTAPLTSAAAAAS